MAKGKVLGAPDPNPMRDLVKQLWRFFRKHPEYDIHALPQSAKGRKAA